VPEGANRKGISGQGRLRLRPGKPDALKDACPVWEEAVGNVPQGNALAAYFIKGHSLSSYCTGRDQKGSLWKNVQSPGIFSGKNY